MQAYAGDACMSEIAGKARGGVARAVALSPKERAEIAKKAAAARWDGDIKHATHGSDDHPLRIGDIEIPCYVLDDETRVLSQRGLQTGIGMSISGGSSGEQRVASFVESIEQKGVDVKGLVARIRNPIRFRPPGRHLAFGFEATILADICDVVLDARKKGVLLHQQNHIADRCEILVRGFARVGIIALVDEATGYQRDRAKDALARILEAFIAKELRPWLRTFPDDFYQEMFRLRNMEYPTDTVQRPRYFGLLTNDIVYDRLAPGVTDELKKINPKTDSGRRKHKNFQWLTSNVGYPKLREHLGSVVAIMKLSADWYDFRAKLDRLHPRYGKETQLSFQYAEEEEDDSGKGL
jgi:P63C domain